MQDEIISRIISITKLPSSDNGKKFTRTDRLKAITKALKKSDFILMKKMSLSRIYQHKLLDKNLPIVVISSHIDSVQSKYYAEVDGDYIHGTFDNSACTALLLEMMITGRINPQTIVVFTGNEEQDGKGAKQVSKYIKKTEWLDLACEFIISLDLTNDFIDEKFYTLENCNNTFIKQYSEKILPDAGVVLDAAPDDSWNYSKYNFSSFSLCLPCFNIGEDMHSIQGVSIRIESLMEYMNALEQLITPYKTDYNLQNLKFII